MRRIGWASRNCAEESCQLRWSAQRLNVQPRDAREFRCDLDLRCARLAGCNVLLGSPPWLRTVRAVSNIPRRAAFTDCPVGKAAATSGSSTTTLLSRRSFSTYLPRTPPRIEAKSYSARISSLRWFPFIKSSFLSCSSPRTDDSNDMVTFSMRHDQQFSPSGYTDSHESRFIFRVIFARKSC